MVAKPPVMIACSSLVVARGRNGRTMSGASVWPRNTLAQADRDSAPDVRITRIITHAMARTTCCMTPRW